MVKLSASRIKTYSSCSYLGYLKYNCKLPSSGNTGSRLGGVTHSILECLAEHKRSNLVDQCIILGDPLGNKSLLRYAKILLKREGELSQENLEKVNQFLLTALVNDFKGNGCNSYLTEYEFDIKTDKYWIGGFIDRLFVYDDKIRILDFKTSKKKFAKGSEDMDFNIQALMYALVASKMYPDKKISVEFLFLKFKKDPWIRMEFTQEQLNGFENYLEYISDYLNDFSIEKALGNMASSDVKRRWLCGKDAYTIKADGSTAWSCEYRAPFLYFEAIDGQGQCVKSAFNKKELDKYKNMGYTIIQKRHSGCPKFH